MAPVINNCPNSDTHSVSCTTPSRPVLWVPPTATDDSGGIPTVSSSHQPGSLFNVGTTPVVYTFTDSAGNSAQCAFTVTVVASDSNPPVVSNCPQSTTYMVSVGISMRQVTWLEPTATDDCTASPTVFRTHNSGDNFPIGVTQVRYLFTDDAGNQGTCTFTITGKYVKFICHCFQWKQLILECLDLVFRFIK